MSLTGSQLAGRLGVSRARVSQYVTEGKLDGCFVGEGRARRFDLAKVQAALAGRLDKGQMLDNGAGTKRSLRAMGEDPDTEQPQPRGNGPLAPSDPDRYELARIANAEQDARRKRRDNERDEGNWVLAEEAERNAARLVAREVAQFEVILRSAARAIAVEIGGDFRQVRGVLMKAWRDHRASRASALGQEATEAQMTDAEKDASI